MFGGHVFVEDVFGEHDFGEHVFGEDVFGEDVFGEDGRAMAFSYHAEVNEGAQKGAQTSPKNDFNALTRSRIGHCSW